MMSKITIEEFEKKNLSLEMKDRKVCGTLNKFLDFFL